MQAQIESADIVQKQTGNNKKTMSENESKIRFALRLTIAICCLYALFIGFLALLLHITPSLQWDRYIYLLTGIETITFTAIGWLFGREISRGEIQQTELRVADTQQQAVERIVDNQRQARQQIVDTFRQAEQRVADAQQQAELRVTDVQQQTRLRIEDINKRVEQQIGYERETAQQQIAALRQELERAREQSNRGLEQAQISERRLTKAWITIYRAHNRIQKMQEQAHEKNYYIPDFLIEELDKLIDELIVV